MSSQPTLDQRRAAHALDFVRRVQEKTLKEKKDFKTQTRRMPARIVTSGLGQSLAFLEAKRYAPDLRDALADWIATGCTHLVGTATASDRLLFRLIEGDSTFLRFATDECLAYLRWLVRLTDAELADVAEDDETTRG